MNNEIREELKEWTVYSMIEGGYTFMDALVHAVKYLELDGVSFDGQFQQEVVAEVNKHLGRN